MENETNTLFETYENKIDYSKYIYSDVIPRRGYFFVDIIYSDKSKETFLRFDTKAEAESFQQYISQRYYDINDETLYNSKDLTLTAFAFLLIGGVIGYAITLF